MRLSRGRLKKKSSIKKIYALRNYLVNCGVSALDAWQFTILNSPILRHQLWNHTVSEVG
jgi:hypothetical protein